MPATSSSVGSGAAGAAIFADSDSRNYHYFEPKGATRDPLRGRHRRRPARSGTLPDPGLDHRLPQRRGRLRQGLRPAARAATGTPSAPPTRNGSAPITSASRRSRRWCRASSRTAASSGAPSPLRHGLGEGPARPSRRLEARRVRPRHLADAGAALRLHPDDQQRDADQLFLQAAARPGHHALPRRDRHGHPRLGRRGRQEGLAGGRHLAGHARGGRDHHGRDRLSRAVFRDQPGVRAAGRRAVPLAAS